MRGRIVEEQENNLDPKYVEAQEVPRRQRWYNRTRLNSIRQPSLLSIIFGLLVVGILAAGVYYYYYGNRSLSTDISNLGSDSKDAVTTGAVKTVFSLNKQLAQSPINVTTNDGVVTLAGTINSFTDKMLAESLARGTRGVENVIDNLTITPTGKMQQQVENLESQNQNLDVQNQDLDTKNQDLGTQNKVLEAFLGNEALKGQNITAQVKDHVVTLAGSVDTQRHKDIAVTIARQIVGIRAVNDQNLTIRNLPEIGSASSH